MNVLKDSHSLFLGVVFILLFIAFIRHFFKEGFQNALEQHYTVVLIESRRHKAMRFVLRNLLDNLDDRWTVLIFHGTSNGEWLRSLLDTHFSADISRVRMEFLGVPVNTIDEYSTLMMTKDFYKSIPTEMFLIAQTDSMICSPQKGWVDDFLQYDYVGAPWTKELSDIEVGNGGFSLRRKSKMLKILDRCPALPAVPEDLFFSRGCEAVRPHKPSLEEAKRFSQESIRSERSFGIHQIWNYFKSDMNEIEKQCPGIQILWSLQGVE